MTHPHAQDGPQWIEFSPAQDEPESRFFKPPTGKCPEGAYKSPWYPANTLRLRVQGRRQRFRVGNRRMSFAQNHDSSTP
jgi:hypothetical protein